MKILRTLLLSFIISGFFYSCKNIDVFEKTESIPNQSWSYDLRPEIKFNVTDTTSRYNIFVVIRHTDAYQYNNIWLKIDMKSPGDSLKTQKLDITLASDAKGWAGTGIDDIFEYRKNITPGPVPFKKAGDYIFTLSQIMRESPLSHILSIGIRVEKVKD